MRRFPFSSVLFVSLLAFSASASSEGTRIRVMTANISSGSRQSYDGGEGVRIFQGLKPDVVMIQEFNYGDNSASAIGGFVATAFSAEYSYYREGESTDQIPNGVISRFPIVQSGEWNDSEMPNRDFAWARIDIPGSSDLWAISVHLSAKKSDARTREARSLVKLVQENIPPTDYVVLGGDFNVTTRTDSVITTLGEVVSERAAPTDSEGISETNMTRRKNYDWVLSNSAFAAFEVPVKIAGSELAYPSGLVFLSTTFPNLDAVKPIQPSDSVAPGMQHLPVLKDFLIPTK